MELVLSNSERATVTQNVGLSQKSRKKGKKSSKKSKKKSLAETTFEEQDGLFFPGLHFVSKPECRKLYKDITDEFSQWLKWQRNLLLCGLTGKCSKSLLRTMNTVVEPVLHGSFKITSHGTGWARGGINKGEIQSLSHNEKIHIRNKSSFRDPLDVILDQNEVKTAINSMMSNLVAQESFLPPIKPQKTTLTGELLENSSCIRHKHCNKDEIKSTPSKHYFPDVMVSRSDGLGKICSTKDTIHHFEVPNQNYNSRIFKNRKWWSSSATSSSFQAPNGKRLLDNLKHQLDTIYKWFAEWTDAEQGACILEILSICQLDEVEYFGQCIIQRLKDSADINRLPDHLILNIFWRLSANEVLSTASVCKKWHQLAGDQQLWKDKCHFLGIRHDIPDVVRKMETAACGSEIDWKISYKDLFLKIQERDARMEELKAIESEESWTYENEDTESLESYGGLTDLTSTAGAEVAAASEEEFSEDDESSVVSGMTDFLNGDLGMIEDTVQQLSAQAKRAESRKEEDDTALDIRPEVSIQAANKLIQPSAPELENLFKFVSIDGIKMLKRVRKLQGHLDAVLALQFDKKRVITGSADRTARLWDVRSGRSIHKLKGHKGGVRSLCFDKEYIITGSWDTTIIIWSAVKFKRITTLDEHKDCVSCLDMNDDILVSGSHDRTVKIWNKHTWICSKTLKGHHGCVMCLCIVDNCQILTGGMDRTAKLWSIDDGLCLRSFSGSSDVILTIKSYGDLVAAGANDGTLLFWDINTGKCEGIISAHRGPLHSISFHSTRFVTAGGDQLLKEWDLSTCSCIRSFTGHKDVVLCVQATSRRIVSGSADGTIRIWDMSSRLQ